MNHCGISFSFKIEFCHLKECDRALKHHGLCLMLHLHHLHHVSKFYIVLQFHVKRCSLRTSYNELRHCYKVTRNGTMWSKSHLKYIAKVLCAYWIYIQPDAWKHWALQNYAYWCGTCCICFCVWMLFWQASCWCPRGLALYVW